MPEPRKFRKKPVVIEAFQLGVDPIPDWFMDKGTTNDVIIHDIVYQGGHCTIKTLEGTMRGEHGDWIIKGVAGEVYPCKPHIFAATYEAVDA